MRKHKCYNIKQGGSGRFLNPTDKSGGLLMCRERNCSGVCTVNTDFITQGVWNFPQDLKSGPLSIRWVSTGKVPNE
ncbi:hypothetical protein AX774_g4189 [Zancudomyces culisetae]|uniref:Uncharacterized protein n=1 Tax=Zancudomyces culisetae TaxID=1213189 RepID=A0A1R1PN50_ZANCU|nr:hypothetical protein AX774_g4189 [Zancudomyces culisetae]|eukprot:OMH82333.1 hypothetical protein AX774_g4189 [Zancudomyces culisetae]